jgi:phosphinothricin acetyltransferase
MTKPAPTLRHARVEDAAAIQEIYRPFVQDTAISFETDVPTIAQMSQRIEASLTNWAWLVAEVNGEIAGYAYGSSHRARAAYNWSVETSAYLHPDFHRQGIASLLYGELFKELEQRKFGSAFAGITVPNDASIGFHAAMGFEMIGRFPKVGRKFGRWHDVAWMSRPICEQIDENLTITA